MRPNARSDASADWPIPPNGHAALTVPSRDFATLRRTFIVTLIVTAILPIAFLLHDGMTRWHKALGNVSELATHAWITAALAIAPSMVLFLIAFVALRRLNNEEKAWRQWQAEAAQRSAVEEDYRHALKMESLGRLTGSIAHDFNNLLMILSANARLIRLKAGEADLDKQWRAIERAVQSGEALTRRLLSASHKQPTHAERIDLYSRLAEWKGLLEASASAQCDVHIAVPGNVRPVFADPTDLQLALINLVANARDALPTGGRIVISAHNHRAVHGHTDEQPAARPDLVCITVSDNGCGMSADVAARAFEPFFTTKALSTGTGLGLPQVYGFCQQAGGNARISSHPGVGTTVALLLPAAQPHGHMVTSSTSAGLDLLLVEDNQEVAEAAAAILNLDGHRVTTAPDAHSALQIYRRHAHYDAVISDVTMPGTMDGIDLAIALRNENPRLPVILVTGHTDKLSLAQSEGLLVLPKPVNFDALRSALPHAA